MLDMLCNVRVFVQHAAWGVRYIWLEHAGAFPEQRLLDDLTRNEQRDRRS